MMDEADKYKQRLEAIAEKRRLQEEQDRARREMDDEKLRLQQLKRKSLRDQWLMEGAPLSPTSPDSQSPRSPLWGSQAQEIEKHIDKLQSESQQLAKEEEKLKEQMEEQMEDSQMEAVKVAEAGAEIVQDAVVQNGENNATGLETTDDDVKTNFRPLPDETAAVLTNGGGDLKAGTNHESSKQSYQSTANGPVVASEGVASMKLELGLSLGVSEEQSVQVPNVHINEDEEEGSTLVMRAERVLITDEGDDVPEDLTPLEDQQETMQLEEPPLLNPEVVKEGVEAMDEEVKTGAAPEMFTHPEKSEATEHNKQLEDPSSVQVPPPANALEGTPVAPVPVSETPPSALTPELEVEVESAITPEGAEATIKAHDPSALLGQFQEVPLADPQENQRIEAGPGEQEPLLLQAKATENTAEPAAANSPASTETHSPVRASQGEETNAPKRKTCQCCSIM